MVLESDTRQYVSENTKRWPQREMDCEIPCRLERRLDTES